MFEVVCKASGLSFQRSLTISRQHDQAPRFPQSTLRLDKFLNLLLVLRILNDDAVVGGGSIGFGGLLQNEMGIGSSKSKVVDRGATCLPSRPHHLLNWDLISGKQIMQTDNARKFRSTFMFHFSNGIDGFGLWKSQFGNKKPFSNIRAALIMATTPLAPSKWPMLDFTEPMYSGCLDLAERPRTAPIAAASIGSPTAVPYSVNLLSWLSHSRKKHLPVPWHSTYSVS